MRTRTKRILLAASVRNYVVKQDSVHIILQIHHIIYIRFARELYAQILRKRHHIIMYICSKMYV